MKNINYSKIFDKLFPINRSLLGDEYRKSLGILKNFIKIRELKYKSGKKIFDWIIPNEWKIKEGYIKYKNKIIIDYKNCNLHVPSYSDKINKKLPLEKLQNNLYSLPKYPRFVPYVTSYYEKNWGFCMSHKQRKSLKRGSYHCYINSEFKKGYLVNGLAELKGNSKKINLVTTYLCHPSLANDNLSGPLVMIGLYNKIKNWNVVKEDQVFKLTKYFKFENFEKSLSFINQVSIIAETEGHHPDLSFGWGYANIIIFTHAVKGLTESDFILAAKIDQVSA